MKLENKPKYLTYSGASVSIMLNPSHWSLRPFARKEKSAEIWEAHNWEFVTGWLFLTIRIWIDDGTW